MSDNETSYNQMYRGKKTTEQPFKQKLITKSASTSYVNVVSFEKKVKTL